MQFAGLAVKKTSLNHVSLSQLALLSWRSSPLVEDLEAGIYSQLSAMKLPPALSLIAKPGIATDQIIHEFRLLVSCGLSAGGRDSGQIFIVKSRTRVVHLKQSTREAS